MKNITLSEKLILYFLLLGLGTIFLLQYAGCIDEPDL
jgi:hypothetical protein